MHRQPPQWFKKPYNDTKNLHKYTQNLHNDTLTLYNLHKFTKKPPQIDTKTCTKRRETTTALLSHLAGDGRLKGRITETNNGDEPPQELKGTCEYLSPGLYEGIKHGWYICRVLMVTVGFSRTRAARSWKCGQRNRLLRTSWTEVSWTESWFPVIKFCGPTCCLVGAQPRTGRLCSGWSIHPQSISDSEEVRCVLRAQRILKKTKITRSRSWHSFCPKAVRQNRLLWFLFICDEALNESQLTLQAWCCQMFSIRSVGNVVLLANRLILWAV